jgi:hypothetical protein
VVLVIRVVMDEFMQTWTGRQNRSPMKHGDQRQRDDLPGAGCGILPETGLPSVRLSVHEMP